MRRKQQEDVIAALESDVSGLQENKDSMQKTVGWQSQIEGWLC